MFTNPQPLNKKNDRDLRIIPREDFAFSKDQVSALLGTPSSGNMALEDGQWNVGYIPAVFRAYPFLLMQLNNEEKQLTIGVDKGCSLLSNEEGEALFKPDGEPSDFLLRAGEMLRSIEGDQQRAALLGSHLASKKLLVHFSVGLTPSGEQEKAQVFSFDGLYFVEEKSLAELSDEDFLFLKKEGVLPFLYAHIFSLAQVSRVFKPQMATETVTQ